jgi:phosphoenolpyruvate synthase/pyruvate phosphate dikinase
MELIRPFGRLGKGDAGIAGGKGASLGEMTQAGIPVPPGFVVLAGAFERFLEDTDLNQELDSILHTVNHQELRTVELASEKIQDLIRKAPMPPDIAEAIHSEFKKLGAPYVAVRSSATAEDSSSAAWAGQLETYLNTTEEQVLENVQRCWASLFTPRAIFYRFEKGMHGSKISVAVVVQKMVQSEVSGIAFSVHPVTEDYNQLIIEAGFGLGEAIVSGQVTPDSFVIEKEPRRIIDKNITYQSRALWRGECGGNEWRELSEVEGSKPALSDEQALALAELVLHIEKHYGFPCDIEWAYEAGTFYITQSRPITTLSNKEPAERKLNVRDYTLTFEGDGMTFGFEYALYSYYWPRHSLSIILNGSVREFVHNPVLELMERDGLACTPEKIRLVINDMESAISTARAEVPKLLMTPLTKSGLKKIIEYGGAIATAYYELDPHFWDGVFERSADNKDARHVIDMVGEYKNKAREYFNEFYFGQDSLMRQALVSLSQATSVPVTDLEMYSGPELLTLLDGLRIPQNRIDAREEAFAIVREDDLRVYEGAAALEFAADFFAGSPTPTGDQVLGRKAHSTGKIVRGIARLITRDYTDTARMRSEMDAMKHGEILVTQTTDPEMMSALRKAAAAVTDIGGMLSHTAIVARELNIPCIVDTKFATQIFKNGDMVEVDADNGIVRKIGGGAVYEKAYTRENCLIAFQIWEEHQTKRLMSVLEWVAQPAIFDVTEGVAGVYYNEGTFDGFDTQIMRMWERDRAFVRKTMEWYGGLLDYLEEKWRSKKPIASVEELSRFYDTAVQAWCGLDVSYEAPKLEQISEADRELAMKMRERAADFLEEIDHVVQRTLLSLYPELGALIKYLRIEEVRGELPMPAASELRAREAHYLYYKYEVITGMPINSFLQQSDLTIREEKPQAATDVQGQAAFRGVARGRVRVLRKKSEISLLEDGEILVTAMTTPDYLPAMHKAAAFVTDEGGITCHAAIVARELKKPCIIGTKFATQVFKDGDMVEVGADTGVVRKI